MNRTERVSLLARRLFKHLRRQKGAQSRPIHVHGIDFVSSAPHIFTDHLQAQEFEQELKPGVVLVIEPNAVTADGQFGIFFGHTFIIKRLWLVGTAWRRTMISRILLSCGLGFHLSIKLVN